MLNNYKKSVTISCVCMTTVEENGAEKQVAAATMNAHFSESGSVNISKTITNKDAFTANRAEVLADFAEFEAKVFEEEGVTA